MKKIISLAKTYAAYRKRVEQCGYAPTRIWIEVASGCNLKCDFCGNKDMPAEDKGLMEMGLFRRLADECAGRVQQFNLFHRGEPLLHPQIGEMVSYASSRGIRTRINTNGTLLTKEKAEELVGAGLDMLSFSFDGYDREMYEANRRGADFDATLGNILSLLRVKRARGSEKPFVAIELMEISERPRAEIDIMRREFLRRFEGLPLDKFILRRPHNWGGMLGSAEGKAGIACPLLWHALVVFWDGRVFPCPQDFFGVLRIGDVRSESLFDIWNGEALRALRAEMRRPGDVMLKPCAECDRIRRLTIAGIPIDYLGRFVSENILGNGRLGRLLPH
ncbi:MAG: radical SAM protein [Armatimonadota bacterium]